MFPTLRFFSPSEFSDPSRMDPDFLIRLDRARLVSDIPYVINSSFRTPEQNTASNGSRNSAHLRGKAVDIRCVDAYTRSRILFGLISAGFTRIGIGKSFIHVDNDDSLPNPRIWLY